MAKRKKRDFEIRFYEGLIKHRPNFIQALISLGDAYTKKKFYQEGLEVDKRLVKLKPQDPIVHYNLACSLSLVEKVEEAFAALEKAMYLGYRDFSHLLKDPDLDNLRKHPYFKDFFSRVKKA